MTVQMAGLPPDRRKYSWSAWLFLLALQACADVTGTGGSITVLRQPTHAVVNQVLSPPIEVYAEDGGGQPASGSATIAISPNPCEWPLGGTTTAPFVDGHATFADLTLGQVAQGYVLEVQWDPNTAVTAPIDVASAGSVGPLTHANTLCMKPNEQKDAESLSYVAEEGAFWLADDDEPSIFRTSVSGEYLSRFTADSIARLLPTAGNCDDGDNDPTTNCSYLGELEHVTHDPVHRLLYVLNTVNDEAADPVEDRPAVYQFRREGCTGCLTPVGWQPLVDVRNVGGLVAIDGELHVALGRALYRYDFATNVLLNVDELGDPLPPAFTATGSIRALSYDGTDLWLLLSSVEVVQVEWTTGVEVARYDIAPFGLQVPKGLQRVGNLLYLLEGAPPNPILVVALPTP
jgi:hypothetical protein